MVTGQKMLRLAARLSRADVDRAAKAMGASTVAQTHQGEWAPPAGWKDPAEFKCSPADLVRWGEMATPTVNGGKLTDLGRAVIILRLDAESNASDLTARADKAASTADNP